MSNYQMGTDKLSILFILILLAEGMSKLKATPKQEGTLQEWQEKNLKNALGGRLFQSKIILR